MPSREIENPIVNGPYDEPSRHFRAGDQGITSEIVNGRRISAYFLPVADKKVYVVQTSPMIAQRCLLMTTDPGDLVLDPTCGSGTTAYSAERWGGAGLRATLAELRLHWPARA